MDLKQLKKNRNLEFLTDTQPMGNLVFLDTMIQVGNTFMTSLYIYRYPTDIEGFWQSNLHNIPNTYVITDISNQESDEVMNKVQRAIREQYSQAVMEREEYQRDIAAEEYHFLNQLAKDIRRNNNTMKYMTNRIIVYADSRYDLEKRIEEVRRTLQKDQFLATPLAMEQEYEYQSFFLDHVEQRKLPNHRIGLDVPSDKAALTFPANHVFMHDKRGQQVGYSRTGGNIILDMYELDGVYRMHYNFLLIGHMGSGKSTFLKKIMYNMAAKGYVIRGFDKSGEYSQLIKYLDGKEISLDGTEGKINIFQVFPTIVNDETHQVNEQASFEQHLSKLGIWYQALNPKASEEEVSLFRTSLSALYKKKGFHGDKLTGNYTTQHPESYPILSEVVAHLEERLSQSEKGSFERTLYEKLVINLTQYLESFGHIFNGYTSISNLLEEQILFFNIDGLMALNNKNIQTAQLFNALSLCWATLLNHGKKQVRLYERGEIAFDFIKRSLMLIDECHNLINWHNPYITEYINTMQREGRKYFIGVGLATQSPTSLVPKQNDDHMSELLREIYKFSQYRFFFRIDSSDVDHLKDLTSFDIAEGQIESVPRYPQGRCLMSISGSHSLEFDVEASSRELTLFRGGGRKAEDL